MGVLAFIRYKKVEKQIDEDLYQPSLLLNMLLTAAILAVGIFLVIYLIHSTQRRLSHGVFCSIINLKAANAGGHYEYAKMYPGFAEIDENAGFPEIARRLRAIAKAEEHYD